MKKQINLLLAGLLTWGVLGCSEETLTPSEPSHNFAARPDEEDYEIRHDFFEKHNCYLIFNDTLRHDYVGTDEDGDAFYDTELVAPEWVLTGTDTYSEYRFKYFTTQEEKRTCADFLADVMELLNKHNLTKPYSILPVKEIEKRVDDYGDIIITYHDLLITLRCFIVDLSEIDNTEATKYRIASNIAGSGISTKYAKEFTPFYNLMADEDGYTSYGKYHWRDYSIEELNEMGFLEKKEGDYFCTQAEDVAAYLNMLLTMTPQQVERRYGDYDIILQKYETLREIADLCNIKY